jgi:hypothetical protein
VIPELIVAVVAVVALAWVLAPIRRGPGRTEGSVSARIEEATAQKDAALIAMVDIENERELGKLSEADFQALRAEYEREALAALRDLDAGQIDDVDDLEVEIAAMKARLGDVSITSTCAACGAARAPGGPCPTCGSTS